MNNSYIKLSIILPCYNVELYIAECLDSMLMQTFENYEVIAVNDGSTDGTLSVLSEYAAKSEHIRVITTKNGGLSAARNRGLREAKGIYCWFVDSDDKVAPNAFERIVSVMEKEKLDLVHFNEALIKESENYGVQHPNPKPDRGHEYEKNHRGGVCLLSKVHRKDFRVAVWRFCIRTDLLRKNNFSYILNNNAEDRAASPEFFIMARRAMFLKEDLYVWRERGDSLSHTVSPEAEEWRAKSMCEVVVALSRLSEKYKLADEDAYALYKIIEWNLRQLRKVVAHYGLPLSKLRDFSASHDGDFLFRYYLLVEQTLLAADSAETSIIKIKHSASFRLGYMLLAPLRSVRKIVGRLTGKYNKL